MVLWRDHINMNTTTSNQLEIMAATKLASKNVPVKIRGIENIPWDEKNHMGVTDVCLGSQIPQVWFVS